MSAAHRALPGFRQRPNNIEAEQALLGAILINNAAFGEVSGYLEPGHFYEPVHSRIYAAMQRHIAAGRLVDHVLLRAEFEQDEALRELEGAQYLARMARAAESIVNAAEYGHVIHDLAVKRAAIHIGEALVNRAYDLNLPESAADQLAIARAQLEELAREAINGAAVPHCLSPAEWEARNIPPEDKLLGPFSTTTRAEISADTGLGKTMLGLGRSTAIALGVNFLRWQGHRSGRTLYVDGEMPPDLIKTRLKVARSWFGLAEPLTREHMCLLSRDDIEDMPPLDMPEGARWLLDFLDREGPFDDITFDNRTSLTVGDQVGDDATSKALKELQRQITKLRAGQLWLHHTGYETTRGYGRKSREWELDIVGVGERMDDRSNADVAMLLKFTKARRRTPENRADYEPLEIELRESQWYCADPEAGATTHRLGRNQKIVRDAATKLLAGSTTKAPLGHPAGNAIVVAVQTLMDETRRMMACEPKHFTSRFNEGLNGLSNARRIEHYDGYVWGAR